MHEYRRDGVVVVVVGHRESGEDDVHRCDAMAMMMMTAAY
jgi:hypothetical protein